MRMISVVMLVITGAFVATTCAVAAPAASSDDGSLFTVTYLIHTEIEAIWNRQMSMLIGNSVIIGAIKLGEKEGSPALNIAMALAGLVLCVAWGIMNYQGWDFSHALLASAQEAAAQLRVNPYKTFPTTFGAEVIFYCAMSVVVVFVLLYLWLLGWMFWGSAKRTAKSTNTLQSSEIQKAEAAQV